MVVDLRTVVGQLPHSIEGFFCPVGASASARAKLRATHAAFVREYGLPATDTPSVVLVQLDLRGTGEPFAPLGSTAGAESVNPASTWDDPDPVHHAG